jgi:hypothetical protein
MLTAYTVEKKIDPALSCASGKSWDSNGYRLVILDWIVEVLELYPTIRNSYCLFSIYLEKYYSKSRIVREDIQLIGIVCLWMATKINTRDHLDTKTCNYLTAHTYNVETIIKQEVKLLKLFDYKLLYTTVTDAMLMYIDKQIIHTKDFSILSLYVKHAIWRIYQIASTYTSMEIGFSVATIINFMIEAKDISLTISTNHECNYRNCLNRSIFALSKYAKREKATKTQKYIFNKYKIPTQEDFIII